MKATLLQALGVLLQQMAVLSRTAKQTYHGTPDSVLVGCLWVVHVLVSCFVLVVFGALNGVVDHGAGNMTA